MIQVKISKDIQKYQNKTLWGFSPRQVICSIIAVAIGLLINFKMTFIPHDLRGFLIMFIGAPLIGCGFVRVQGMTLEKYIRVFIKTNLVNKERLFMNESIYDYLDKKPNKRKRGKHEKKVTK